MDKSIEFLISAQFDLFQETRNITEVRCRICLHFFGVLTAVGVSSCEMRFFSVETDQGKEEKQKTDS